MHSAVQALASIVVSAACCGLMAGPAGSQSPDDPWSMQASPDGSTSAALVGSGEDGLTCPETAAGEAADDSGVAANIMCIIGGARAGQRATEPPPEADPEAAPPVRPTTAEIVEGILSGAQ
jgi:hypothetical protein